MIGPSQLRINDYRISSRPEPEAPPVPEPSPPSCGDCRFALLADVGYSNYTVEGTEFYCTIGLHPEDGFDRWYGADERLDFAKECRGFTAGEPIRTDVDGEDFDELTEGQKMLLEVSAVLHKNRA